MTQRPLFARNDPPSSARAAEKAVKDGVVAQDERFLLSLVRQYPGKTMEELGYDAAVQRGGDPFYWRIKLGRRTGPMKERDEIRAINDRESGLARWYPGEPR